MPTAPNYTVPALEKGLDVIEALAAVAVPLSLAELGVKLKRSSGELFRMLNCLEARGYLAREAVSGKYALTLKLYSLAHAHSITEKLLRAAQAPMQQLTERIRESCHLSVLDRGQLLVVAQQESPEAVRLSIEVGAVFDPAATASGRLLLAQQSDLAADSATRGASRAAGNRRVRAASTARATAAALRETGVSTAESETIQGVRDLAVLVGNPATGIVAALAVTRLQRRGQQGNDAGLIAAMKSTAATITRALGLEAVP